MLRKNIFPGIFSVGYRSLDGHASLWTKPICSIYGIVGGRTLPENSRLVSGFVSDKPNSGMELARALCVEADRKGTTLVAVAFGGRKRLYASLGFEAIGGEWVVRNPHSAKSEVPGVPSETKSLTAARTNLPVSQDVVERLLPDSAARPASPERTASGPSTGYLSL